MRQFNFLSVIKMANIATIESEYGDIIDFRIESQNITIPSIGAFTILFNIIHSCLTFQFFDSRQNFFVSN